jgi:hypothetical protein
MEERLNRQTMIVALCSLALMSLSASPQLPTDVRTPVGVWNIKGVDDRGRTWIGTAVLIAGSQGTLRGHIDWLASNGSCGREHVVGRFDSTTRALQFTGRQTEYAVNLVPSNYLAYLSNDGLQLQNGRWGSGARVVPGGWSARRIDFGDDGLGKVSRWEVLSKLITEVPDEIPDLAVPADLKGKTSVEKQ